MKSCKICGVEKPLTEFGVNKTYKDGHSGRCKSCSKIYLKAYYSRNKESLNSQGRANYVKNKQPYLDRSKKRRESDPIGTREYLKQWRRENREYLNQKMVHRLHTDPEFKLKHTLRAQLRKHLRGEKDNTSTFSKYLGCSVEFLRGYFESKFRDGMAWNNYGKVWHIDHILPCRSFDLTKDEDRHKCFHYSNLQPLLVSENLSKLDKLPDGSFARNLQKSD